ncbi:MAG TPA: DUF3445 domain-containing protein [Stellaceae bacterium]|nr:DUF3445 domain-containing protein [Stellaceae bacterium]
MHHPPQPLPEPRPEPAPVYLPFEDAPFRMAMGLTAERTEDWIELDEHYTTEMALRRDLLAQRHDEVFATQPGSEAAQAEVLNSLAQHLCRRFPAWFEQTGYALRNRLTGEHWDLANPPYAALELAGRLVQEDLCILQEIDGAPHLTAAILCFPSRWRLADKIGRPMHMIHAPVPFYGERLSKPVDRFIGLLKDDKLVSRLNWSVIDDPALFQPTGKGRTALDPSITAQNAGERLVLRVERQTLRRLPETGAVLFTIKLYVRPIAGIAAAPELASRLAGAVRALPPDMQRYKSLQPYRQALLDYLDHRGSMATP